MGSKCDTCIHKKVCCMKKDYDDLKDYILNYKNINDNIYVMVQCKEYSYKDYNIK